MLACHARVSQLPCPNILVFELGTPDLSIPLHFEYGYSWQYSPQFEAQDERKELKVDASEPLLPSILRLLPAQEHPDTNISSVRWHWPFMR